jgi:hypothetical protein
MEDFHKLGLKLKFVYSVCGLILGLSCIVAGAILGLSGVVGNTSFTASLLGLSTQLTDAAPGVIVFVVGIFMVFITRFRVSHVREHSDGERLSPVGDSTPAGAITTTINPAVGPILREEINYSPIDDRHGDLR